MNYRAEQKQRGDLRPHPSSRTICTWVSPLVRKILTRILYLADGDAYTGRAFGGFKGNNAQLLTQISAIFSANSSPAPTGAQTSGNGVTGDQDMDDALEEDDGGEPTWEDVLPTRGRETRRDGGGSAVADRLANPPPLGHERHRQESRPLHRRSASSSTKEEQRRPPAAQPEQEN